MLSPLPAPMPLPQTWGSSYQLFAGHRTELVSGKLLVNGTDLGEVMKEETSYNSGDCVLMSGLESG